jgi:hypothetical protein
MAKAEERRFKVRARHEDVHHGRILLEPSFEAAAIAYAEHLPASDGEHDVCLIVRDVETGHEHSFHLHFDPGEPPEVV